MIRPSIKLTPQIMNLALNIDWRELDNNMVACYCPNERSKMNELAKLVDEYKHKKEECMSELPPYLKIVVILPDGIKISNPVLGYRKCYKNGKKWVWAVITNSNNSVSYQADEIQSWRELTKEEIERGFLA